MTLCELCRRTIKPEESRTWIAWPSLYGHVHWDCYNGVMGGKFNWTKALEESL